MERDKSVEGKPALLFMGLLAHCADLARALRGGLPDCAVLGLTRGGLRDCTLLDRTHGELLASKLKCTTAARIRWTNFGQTGRKVLPQPTG